MSKKKTGRWLAALWLAIKKDAKFYYRAFLHKDVPIVAKLAMIAVVVYTISPMDIIPGWILGLGVLDDLAIITIGVKYIKKLIPERLHATLNKTVIDADSIKDTKKKTI